MVEEISAGVEVVVEYLPDEDFTGVRRISKVRLRAGSRMSWRRSRILIEVRLLLLLLLLRCRVRPWCIRGS